MPDQAPVPVTIKLHQKSRQLEVAFEDGKCFIMSCEYLRAHSPSAEVRGHGPGQEKLVTGKEQVNIARIEPVGNYAVTLYFDDGHHTGIYSWSWLYELGSKQQELWEKYLQKLKAAGYQRQETDENT